jgi:hypothetical protein
VCDFPSTVPDALCPQTFPVNSDVPTNARIRQADDVLHRYRARGADPPFGDPRRGHGIAMEGHFWRLSDPASGRVVVALAGVCRGPDGDGWSNVALAAHPGAYLRAADVTGGEADRSRFRVRAGSRDSPTLTGDEHSLRVELGPRDRLEASFSDLVPFGDHGLRGLGALGPAHLLPGLGQYWHAHLLGARVHGRAVLDGAPVSLDGWTAYAEKNWGAGGFPPRWWWGQAQGFARDDVCVAFAGGELATGPLRTEATGIVVALGDEVIRLGNPLIAPARTRVDASRWSLDARGPVWSVAIRGTATPGEEHVLPVPLPAQHRSVPAAHEHLAARMQLVVRRRGRIVCAGVSELAGLEFGSCADG